MDKKLYSINGILYSDKNELPTSHTIKCINFRVYIKQNKPCTESLVLSFNLYKVQNRRN